jgi:hypothetical protein
MKNFATSKFSHDGLAPAQPELAQVHAPAHALYAPVHDFLHIMHWFKTLHEPIQKHFSAFSNTKFKQNSFQNPNFRPISPKHVVIYIYKHTHRSLKHIIIYIQH